MNFKIIFLSVLLSCVFVVNVHSSTGYDKQDLCRILGLLETEISLIIPGLKISITKLTFIEQDLETLSVPDDEIISNIESSLARLPEMKEDWQIFSENVSGFGVLVDIVKTLMSFSSLKCKRSEMTEIITLFSAISGKASSSEINKFFQIFRSNLEDAILEIKKGFRNEALEPVRRALRSLESRLSDWEAFKLEVNKKKNSVCNHFTCSSLIDLDFFDAVIDENHVLLSWVTSVESNNAGFRIWRVAANGGGSKYQNISVLKRFYNSKFDNWLTATSDLAIDELDELLPAKGSEREKTVYFYVDVNAKENSNSFYYLLEDIDTNGSRTFHCNKIKGVEISQSFIVNEKAAIEYCMNQCFAIMNDKILCD